MAKGGGGGGGEGGGRGFPQFKCHNNIYVTEFCIIFVMTIP